MPSKKTDYLDRINSIERVSGDDTKWNWNSASVIAVGINRALGNKGAQWNDPLSTDLRNKLRLGENPIEFEGLKATVIIDCDKDNGFTAERMSGSRRSVKHLNKALYELSRRSKLFPGIRNTY